MSQQIRVYLIDSAPTSKIAGSLLPLEELRVVGIAQGVQPMLSDLSKKRPSVVILVPASAEEGLAMLGELRRNAVRLKILVVGADTAPKLQFLSSGAAAYLVRPSQESAAYRQFVSELKEKILSLCAEKPAAKQRPKVLVIGSSTGGPEALSAFLSSLPAPFPIPILIVQHMLRDFTERLVERIALRSKIPIAVSVSGALVRPNQIWIAEGGVHLALEERDGIRLLHTKAPPENSCRPAVDVLFRSAASLFGSATFAIVFTGMGRDGTRGGQEIARVGGEVWAQDEASSVVWGMPGSIVQAGLASRVLPLSDMASQCVQLIGEARRKDPHNGLSTT